MKRISIPFLIVAMSVALIGIIVIQYRWIDQSVDEKTALIDHKVHQAVSNIDQQLSDFNTMAFLSMDNQDVQLFENCDTLNCFANPFDKIQAMASVNAGDSGISGNIAITVAQNCDPDMPCDEGTAYTLSNGDTMYCKTERKIDLNSADFQMAFDSGKSHLVMSDKIHNLFKRIECELDGGFKNGRMDSTRIARLMDKEFTAMGLIMPVAWAVFDSHIDKNVIEPAANLAWDFEIPLKKNDIIHPNRYRLLLNIDKSEMLWADVRTMIFLSSLFLAIILLAFAWAIRLVIKHKKISQIKSDFINNMTHEFKTPLASISLAADSILHPKVAGDRQSVEKYIDIIKAEKTKLNDQVERILEVASLEKDALDIPLCQVSINEIVKSTAGKLDMLLTERKAILRITENEQATIQGNEFYLERVITNIIENSIKYSKDTPDIAIRIQKLTDKVVVEIADKGIGMTRAQIERVFDNFYRVQTGNVHNTKGFGLGLSYAKLITEKLRGSISMEGQPDVGCTVKLQFPLAA